MKDVKLYIALLLFVSIVSGCTTDTPIDKFPEDNVSTENCAADGIGCKQFNKDLNR